MTLPELNSHEIQTTFIFLIPVASVIGIFTLLAVVGWARERRRERESLYRHETARKLVEHGQMTFEQFSTFERNEAARPLAQRRRALALAGAVLAITGLSAFVAFRQIVHLHETAPLAFIPLGIGGALLAYTAGTGRRE